MFWSSQLIGKVNHQGGSRSLWDHFLTWASSLVPFNTLFYALHHVKPKCKGHCIAYTWRFCPTSKTFNRLLAKYYLVFDFAYKYVWHKAIWGSVSCPMTLQHVDLYLLNWVQVTSDSMTFIQVYNFSLFKVISLHCVKIKSEIVIKTR